MKEIMLPMRGIVLHESMTGPLHWQSWSRLETWVPAIFFVLFSVPIGTHVFDRLGMEAAPPPIHRCVHVELALLTARSPWHVHRRLLLWPRSPHKKSLGHLRSYWSCLYLAPLDNTPVPPYEPMAHFGVYMTPARVRGGKVLLFKKNNKQHTLYPTI